MTTFNSLQNSSKLRNPRFVPGDLVHVINTDELSLLSGWGKGATRFWPHNRIGEFLPGQIGIIMETLEHQGGNGCRVMVGHGVTKLGWANMYFLRKI